MKNRTVYKNTPTIRKFRTAFITASLLLGQQQLKAQQVTEIFTDFNGYWRSSTTNTNTTYPNNSHNLLAFKVGTDTFSTGANDAALTSRGIRFRSGNYKALPITSIAGTVPASQNVYLALASLYDGVANGYSSPVPSARMRDVLTDGLNGLNLGTGVTNVPATGTMVYSVDSINTNAMSDDKPDFVYTQIADPASTMDVMYFANSQGQMVGRTVSVSWASISSLGTYYLDLYNVQTGVSCNSAMVTSGNTVNTTRNIRLVAYKFSDFGVSATNAATITQLIIKPGGQSDPAFVAYNADAFIIRTPVVSTQPATQVVCPNTGQSATFYVDVSGTTLAVNYQWRKNGVDITGATSSSYTISNVTDADAGMYDVVVSNSAGTVTSAVAYLNTTITAQPTASQKIATGNTVTLAVTANNATSYQWKKDGVNISGATSSTYVINPVTTTDDGTYTVSAINTASGGCASVLSNNAVLNAATILYAKSSGDLNTVASWGVYTDGSGSKPVDFTRTEHKFIIANRATTTTFGNLTIAGTLDVKNSITSIADNSTLDVGALTRSGTGYLVGSNSAALTIRGTSSVYFQPGNELLKDFTITAGTVTMGTPLRISGGSNPGTLNLKGGTLALGNNKITLESTSIANTSMITAIGSTASITYGTSGGFVIERFIPAKRAYRLISPTATTTGSIKDNWMEGVNNPNTVSGNVDPYPGYGTHIAGSGSAASGFDATNTNNPSLFTFNVGTQGWDAVTNTSGTLSAGKAYRLMVRGSRNVNLNDNAATPSNTILRITGKIATGTITVNGSSLSGVSGNYSLVGNPYACPINWNLVTRTNISPTFYAWDGYSGVRGSFVSYNAQTNTVSKASSEVSAYIQSGQGMLVVTTGSNPSLQFTEACKTSGNTNVFRGTAKTFTQLGVELLTDTAKSDQSAVDGFVSMFDNSFSDSIGDEDSYKPTNLDENVGISSNGQLLSIEGRKPIVGSDTIRVRMWQFRHSNYYLKFMPANFTHTTAVLKDNYLKSTDTIPLTGVTFRPLQVNGDAASTAIDRFSIILTSATTLPVGFVNARGQSTPFCNVINWSTGSATAFAKFDIEKAGKDEQFRHVATIAGTSNNYTWSDSNKLPRLSFYRIKAVTASGENVYSPVVRIADKMNAPLLTVYPNPVHGNKINFILTSDTTAVYNVRLLNTSGTKVFARSVSHSGGTSRYSIRTSTLAPGTYQLVLTDPTSSVSKTVIVE